MTLAVVMTAFAESMQSPTQRKNLGKKEKQSFLESLKKEWSENMVSPKRVWSSTERRPATEILNDVNEVAEELKDARNRDGSEASE